MIDHIPHRMRGFSLLEVLVALVILSIGLLGLAAMQASALSSTHGSQTESLVAIQARSLADAMSANPDYWGENSPNFTITSTTSSGSATASTPVFSGGAPTGTVSCLNFSCSATEMASYDLQTWASQLMTEVPGSDVTIACTGSAPIGCSITITWPEKVAAALNSGTANSTGASTTTMSYTLVNQI